LINQKENIHQRPGIVPGFFFFGGTGCSAWLRLAKPASGQQGGVIHVRRDIT
jgi:hypothetical protein